MQDNINNESLTVKSTIIFDLDGTLVDSAPDLSNSINSMLDTLKRKPFNDDLIHSWVGNGAKALVERALSGELTIDSQLDDEYCAKALAIFLADYKENACVHTKLYAGVLSTLNELKSRGYTLNIVTNKPLMFVAPILETLGIKHCFDVVLGAESLPKKKPDPMPLSHICKEQQVDVNNCVMVGDSHNDILAASAIDMESIGMTYGYNYGENIASYNPTIVCDKFSQLLDYLPNLKIQ